MSSTGCVGPRVTAAVHVKVRHNSRATHEESQKSFVGILGWARTLHGNVYVMNRTHWRVHAHWEQSSRWLSCRLFTVLCSTWLSSRRRGCVCEQEFIWIFLVFVATLWSCPRGVKLQVGTLNNWIMTMNNNMDAQAGWVWMGSKCKQMILHCVDRLMWSEAQSCWENVCPDLQYPIFSISLRVRSNPNSNSNPTQP